MATVNPVFDSQIAGGATVTWSGMVTGDTITSHEPNRTRGVAGCVTFTGTFGGATVTL